VETLTADTERASLSYLDLRYDLFAGADVVSKAAAGKTVSDTLVCFSTTIDELSLHDIVNYKQKLTASEITFPPNSDSCFNRRPGEIAPISGYFVPLIPSFLDPRPPKVPLNQVRGSWLVDTSGNLFVSQQTLDLSSNFSYLSDGNLFELLPVAPEGAVYFPAGVIK